MKKLFAFLVLIYSCITPSFALAGAGDRNKPIEKSVTAEQSPCNVTIIEENFNRFSSCDFTDNNPNNHIFTQYTIGSYAGGRACVVNANAVPYSDLTIPCDHYDSNPTGDIGKALLVDCGPLPLLWGKDLPQSKMFDIGTYELSFVTKGNTPFQSNTISSSLANSSGNSPAAIPGILSDAAGNPMPANNVTNTASCGTVVRYRFTVTSSGYNRLIIWASGGGGGNDFIIDDISLRRLTLLPLTVTVPQCYSRAATVTVDNPPGAGYYQWTWENSNSVPANTSTPVITTQGNSSVSISNLTRYVTYTLSVQYIDQIEPYSGCTTPKTFFNLTPQAALIGGITILNAAASPYPPNYELRFGTGAAVPGGYTYVWEWADGTPNTTGAVSSNQQITAAHTFTKGKAGPYQVRLTVYPPGVATCGDQETLPVDIYRPLCLSNVPLSNQAGGFMLNTQTGSIDYVPGNNINFVPGGPPDCLPASGLECLGGQGGTIQRVVAVSMTAFADSLVQDEEAYRPGSIDSNPFLQGQGQVRPYATYTYQAPLAAQSADVNYLVGSFNSGVFDARTSARARPAAWLASAITERVSPNGEVLQERDPLGTRSAAKYGYAHAIDGSPAHALPYLQAHNADASTVLFESFENRYASGSGQNGEDQLPLLAAEVEPAAAYGTSPAHTGTGAAQLKLQGSGQHQLTLKPVPLTTQLVTEGLLVKCWLYLPTFSWTANSPVIGRVALSRVGSTAPVRTQDLKVVAQVGEWCLAESKVDLPLTIANQVTLAAGNLLVPRLQITPLNPTNPVLWVDDIRLQPGGSQLTAYVYDPRNLRLLASFDDQHYALRYQYNSQGQLIRKQAETERGLKTLQETFYHTPQQPHP